MEESPVAEDAPVAEEAPVVEEAPVAEEIEDLKLSGDPESSKPRKKATPAAPKPVSPPEDDLGIVQPEFGF